MAQLPAGITPAISPQSPTGEIFRYVLTNPKDAAGHDIYNLNDLKSLQDYTLERSFRRLPGVADVCSFGGTVKRYEIHPDPARMQRYGITLQQIKDAVSASNPNAGGEYVIEGDTAHVVRFLGLIGYGQDPIETAMGMKDPVAARDYLRSEEERRIREIRRSCSPRRTTCPSASTTWSKAARCTRATRSIAKAWSWAGKPASATSSGAIRSWTRGEKKCSTPRASGSGTTIRTWCSASACCAKATSRCPCSRKSKPWSSN